MGMFKLYVVKANQFMPIGTDLPTINSYYFVYKSTSLDECFYGED